MSSYIFLMNFGDHSPSIDSNFETRIRCSLLDLLTSPSLLGVPPPEKPLFGPFSNTLWEWKIDANNPGWDEVLSIYLLDSLTGIGKIAFKVSSSEEVGPRITNSSISASVQALTSSGDLISAPKEENGMDWPVQSGVRVNWAIENEGEKITDWMDWEASIRSLANAAQRCFDSEGVAIGDDDEVWKGLEKNPNPLEESGYTGFPSVLVLTTDKEGLEHLIPSFRKIKPSPPTTQSASSSTEIAS